MSNFSTWTEDDQIERLKNEIKLLKQRLDVVEQLINTQPNNQFCKPKEDPTLKPPIFDFTFDSSEAKDDTKLKPSTLIIGNTEYNNGSQPHTFWYSRSVDCHKWH